jgi:CPA1 family monovalent cation:H+ antiporter
VGELLLLGALLVGVVVLTPVSDRLSVPQPVLLTVFGLGVALVPGVAQPSLDPDLILPVLLPPLLFAASQRTTVGEFRESARPILLLAVGLTVATTAVVAVVAHAGGLPWAAAWVLGAVVSPPDPVAATAVARRLRLPARMVTVLEGEGMFNDATALVLYQVAVAAAVTGALSAGTVVLELLLAVVVGVGIGLGLGWLARVALAALHDAPAETTVTVVMPFVAYLGAERLHGSGVLAVLALGLYLRSYGHPAVTAQGWLLGRAVWNYVDFILSSLTFTLIGFELTTVLGHTATGAGTVRLAVVVLLVLVLSRAAWMYPAVAIARALQRRADAPVVHGWRETTVVTWAGMRGVVTVATALALPQLVKSGAGFPHRSDVVLVALFCVLVTLVVQGLTLSPLVRALGVGGAADDGSAVAALRARAAQAVLQDLRSVDDASVPEGVRRAVLLQYESYARAQQALSDARRGTEGEAAPEQLELLLERASEVERSVVLEARRSGEVSSETADEVLRDIEARAVRDLD